jgi:hypothetical protein
MTTIDLIQSISIAAIGMWIVYHFWIDHGEVIRVFEAISNIIIETDKRIKGNTANIKKLMNSDENG